MMTDEQDKTFKVDSSRGGHYNPHCLEHLQFRE